MADDDGAGVSHAQDMASIELGIGELGVVGVDAAEDDAEPSVPEEVAHAAVEEAGSGAEVVVWQDHVLGGVDLGQLVLDLVGLLLEVGVGERLGGLVAHGVVGELVAAADHLAQDVVAAVGLDADDEEGGVGIVLTEDLQNVVGIGGRGIVDGERDDLLGGGDLEEDVRELVAEVADEVWRRLVDAPDGVEGE